MVLIIDIIENKIQEGKKNKYNFMFFNHNNKFQLGNIINIAFVKPKSLLSIGIIICKRKEMRTAGININKNKKNPPTIGILAPSFIQFISVLTPSNRNTIM